LISEIIDWTNRIFAGWGAYGLFFLAFIESSVFPIPPDLLLITLALADPSNAFFLSFICTIGSVLGGIFAYWLGCAGGTPLLEKFFSKRKIERVHKLYEKYETLVIFVSGFTPIPYKLFTLSAGVFYVNFRKFVIASIVGRGLRFFILGAFIYYYGERALSFFDTYFNEYTILISLIVILVFVIWRRYK